MPSALLREYVDLIVEKIRSNKEAGQKFNMTRFKSLDNVHMLNVYASKFLSKLGQGSSRAAYQLTSRYVLKVAINEKGIAQNEAEEAVYTNPKTKPITSKVYASDDKNRWLVTDSVREFSDEKDFKNTAGIDWQTFIGQVKAAYKGKQVNATNDLVKATIATVKENNLGIGDIQKIDHWGKTSDGRVVLLDYGYTHEVWDKHYSDSAKQKADDRDAPTAKPGKKAAVPGEQATKKDKPGPDQDRDAPTKAA